MPEIDNERRLDEAITAEMGLPLITKWLVIGEGVDSEGNRSTFYIRSEGCAPWDELGLIEWHRQTRARQGDDQS